MKFKEQRGNVFVFDDKGAELTLTSMDDPHIWFLTDECIWINRYLFIEMDEVHNFSKIQTAVCMMQILIKEGLV